MSTPVSRPYRCRTCGTRYRKDPIAVVECCLSPSPVTISDCEYEMGIALGALHMQVQEVGMLCNGLVDALARAEATFSKYFMGNTPKEVKQEEAPEDAVAGAFDGPNITFETTAVPDGKPIIVSPGSVGGALLRSCSVCDKLFPQREFVSEAMPNVCYACLRSGFTEETAPPTDGSNVVAAAPDSGFLDANAIGQSVVADHSNTIKYPLGNVD